jgi:Mannosyltransferase (PIG-V)
MDTRSPLTPAGQVTPDLPTPAVEPDLPVTVAGPVTPAVPDVAAQGGPAAVPGGAVRLAGWVRRRLAGFAAHDREAVGWWLLSRVAALWIAVHAALMFGNGSGRLPGFLRRWYTWDAQYYVKIARFGYDGPPGERAPLEAFFPGMPMAIRALHVVVPNWTLDGLLVSFLAGAVAVVALARLAVLDGGPRAGGRAALLFCVSPLAVFLAAGYTEALFLAFALPAWLMARRGRWPAACLLAAGASCVRVTGLFLAAGLAVEFLASRLPRRAWRPAHLPPAPLRHLPWLAVPLLPVLGYFAYLRARTGDWGYWWTAQEKGWFRHYTGFRETFLTTWHAAFGTAYSPNFRWSFRVELVAVAVGVVLVAVLAARRRFGEAVYVATSLVALATSTWYLSIARAALLWWPLWTMLAALAVHPRVGPAVTRVYLFASAPLAVLAVAAFTTGRWVG